MRSEQDWSDSRKSKLWLYNLHYFDDLNARESTQRTKHHCRLIRRWIAENPPGRGVGWEPYPTSLRIINWIKWVLCGNDPEPDMIHSLAVQARWLRKRLEYHLLGNHLLANAKALIFAGLFFQGAEADGWYNKGLKILAREIPEQVLPDGGHFERSPMYHLVVLEDLLDLINLHQAYEVRVPEQWHRAVSTMLAWSATMRHPDREIPFFNDAAFGMAPHPKTVDRYAERLGFSLPQTDKACATHLSHSGYARLASERATLFVDMAPVGPDYLPGHAHADTLSFELSLNGGRIIVNSGTSEYGTSEERQRQRGTAAHSTLVVNGANSSEVWAGFRVARRARMLIAAAGQNTESCWAEGVHDGYQGLPGRPTHYRSWTLQDAQLEIIDRVEGLGEHRIDIFFPLHPEIVASEEGDGQVKLIDSQDNEIFFSQANSSQAHVTIETTSWHPYFAMSMPTRRIRCTWVGHLPVEFKNQLIWQPKNSV